MYLRISLTDRCNLRCVYCLPEDARFSASSLRASDDEQIALAGLVARAAGVRKIRLTGGEPTLCPRLLDHVRAARALVPIVGMTSNGILLAPLLPALREAGLNRINISLDAIDADAFRRFARRDGLADVLAAIRAAQRAGFAPVKVNAVAMQQSDLAGLVRFAAYEGVHLRFIELMAIGEARPFQASAYISAAAMRERLFAAGISLRERVDCDEPTSRVYAIDDLPVEQASVGFITTTSAPFCATCNRLRLSSFGRLHTCLMDDHGADLLSPLRTGDGDGVIARVRSAVAAKQPPPRFERVGVMAAIGG